jgi:hypothetical protein
VAVAVAGFVTRRGLREIAIPLLACVAGGNRLSLGPNTPLVMLTPARGDRDGLLPSSLATGGLGVTERSGLGCVGARVVVRLGGAVSFLSRGENSGIRNGDVGPTVAGPGIVMLEGVGTSWRR